jgi:hypothetical protein
MDLENTDNLNAVLRDRSAAIAERMAAVEQSGECVSWDDELAKSLLAIVGSAEENEELRARAAIALGPILEEADMEGFDEDSPFSEPPITQATFNEIQETLRRVYTDVSESKEVRRRAFEGSVRALQDWHADAVRAAYASSDPEWRLTGIFAMQFVPGFDTQILEALESDNPEIRFEAVRAAGEREVKAAWPHIEKLLNEDTEKDLLLVAIEAAAYVNPEDAGVALVELTNSEDFEIAESASEAMAMAEVMDDADDDDEVDDDDEDDEE